jgi:hypothetical protein
MLTVGKNPYSNLRPEVSDFKNDKINTSVKVMAVAITLLAITALVFRFTQCTGYTCRPPGGPCDLELCKDPKFYAEHHLESEIWKVYFDGMCICP